MNEELDSVSSIKKRLELVELQLIKEGRRVAKLRDALKYIATLSNEAVAAEHAQKWIEWLDND